MSKFFCGISGIECEVSYLPLSLSAREYAHPVFFLPQKKLIGLYSRYQARALGDIESYLLYLALLNSTDLVEFRVPAQYTVNTPKIIANNMEDLLDTVFKMNLVTVPSVQFPKIAITPDTKNLENSHFWIKNWHNSYVEFLAGNRARIASEAIEQIENRLQRLIVDPNTNPTKYANVISTWADKAAEFPTEKITTNFGILTKSEYWQLIIRKCVNEKAIFDVPTDDINELISYCSDNLEHGTIYAYSLMKLLKAGKGKQIAYLGFDEPALSGTPYQILDENNTSAEVANLIAIVNSAPITEPKRTDFSSEFQFQRAKIKFQTAQRLRLTNPELFTGKEIPVYEVSETPEADTEDSNYDEDIDGDL